MMRNNLIHAIAILATLVISGCAATQQDVELIQGPPTHDITTPFDMGLKCLRGRINPSQTFSVGTILDSTGKEQLSEAGTGKLVTQGAGDIVQTALLRAGVTVVNRRDPRIMTTEIQWGIGSKNHLIPSKFFITGSINTLDFIPGAGFDATVAGGGPRFRQHRILIGLDLFLTETRTGRIVASIPLQKQIVENEVGFGLGRFFGGTLVDIDIGAHEREALQFTLRHMLHLATFELLTQVMSAKNYIDCRQEIDLKYGVIEHSKTAEATATFLQKNGKQSEGGRSSGDTSAGTVSSNKNTVSQNPAADAAASHHQEGHGGQKEAIGRDEEQQPTNGDDDNKAESFWKNESEKMVAPPGVLY
jgi:curli biogenesis system outer membrane secretion channel CsgG